MANPWLDKQQATSSQGIMTSVGDKDEAIETVYNAVFGENAEAGLRTDKILPQGKFV